MNKQRQRRDRGRGQSLVEVALALPVILMVMLGMLDLGRAYYSLVVINDAADEGATYAAIRPNDVVGVKLRAAEASAALVEIDPNNVNVIYPPGGLWPGQPITVTVAVEMPIFTPFIGVMLDNNSLRLEGKSVRIILSTK